MSVRLRRLWFQLTSDAKRLSALCLCLGVGLLLWARIIIVSNMPRTAIANDSVAQVAVDNAAAGGGGAAAKTGGGRTSRSPVVIDLATSFGRDPFVISPAYFPKPTPVAALGVEAGKSSEEPAEDAQQIEARRTAHRQALLSQMKLEAAMGATMAVISGKPYRRGDEIVGVAGATGQERFVLAEVRQRSVILECDGQRFELKMVSPGRE